MNNSRGASPCPNKTNIMSKIQISLYNTFSKQKNIEYTFNEKETDRIVEAQKNLTKLTRFEAFTIVLTEKID